MKKFILILILIMISTCVAKANDTGYVSPESYAVNEADMTDYFDIPAPQRLNIDELDNRIKFNKTATEPKNVIKEGKTTKVKRAKGEKKPYEERMIYKAAKWWTDQTYKFEDEHHGEKHEIKVKAREEYERQQAEKPKEQDAL